MYVHIKHNEDTFQLFPHIKCYICLHPIRQEVLATEQGFFISVFIVSCIRTTDQFVKLRQQWNKDALLIYYLYKSSVKTAIKMSRQVTKPTLHSSVKKHTHWAIFREQSQCRNWKCLGCILRNFPIKLPNLLERLCEDHIWNAYIRWNTSQLHYKHICDMLTFLLGRMLANISTESAEPVFPTHPQHHAICISNIIPYLPC